MKKSKLFAFAMTAVCIVAMIAPSFAVATRASDQIFAHSVTVTTAPGEINVEFSITGTGRMDKIGCESIYVYQDRSGWKLVEAHVEDDEGMSRENFSSHKNNIVCNAQAGEEYKVVVTLFAENSDGRDTRTKIHYVTGK